MLYRLRDSKGNTNYVAEVEQVLDNEVACLSKNVCSDSQSMYPSQSPRMHVHEDEMMEDSEVGNRGMLSVL